MEKVKKAVIFFIYSISVLVTLCSILSIFWDTEIRHLKMLDFPRIQFFLISLASLILMMMIVKITSWYDYLIIFALLIALAVNGIYLINYTPLVPVKVLDINEDVSGNEFSLLLINVKMSNRNASDLIQLIDAKKPDLILAMETDTWWDGQLNVLKAPYPYSQHTINEVAYGMVFYSKFPLKSVKVNYIINKKVPSFDVIVSLSNDKYFNLNCLHPVPPTHYKDLPDNAGQKETALQAIGKKIKKSKIPAIVAGDLNDVVWGNVDQLTETTNLLFDIRVGRGFYNSYNAENMLMRWPLDHVYVTKEFKLKKLERLTNIGSDHFPIYVELVL